MVKTVPSYDEENRDDGIDPNDMLNADPSANTMRKNELEYEDLKRQTPPSCLSGSADTVQETDIPADSSEDLGLTGKIMILAALWRRRVGQLFNYICYLWIFYDLYEKVMKKHKEGKDGDSWFTSLADLVPLSIKIPLTKKVFMPFKLTAKGIAVTVEQFCTEVIPALLVDLLLTSFPVAIAIVALFLFMFIIFLFMWYGYSIRNPFYLANKPGPGHAVADAQIQQAISENTLNIRQPEDIQSSTAEKKNPPDEKDLRLLSPNLPVKETGYQASADNHGGAKVQLDREKSKLDLPRWNMSKQKYSETEEPLDSYIGSSHSIAGLQLGIDTEAPSTSSALGNTSVLQEEFKESDNVMNINVGSDRILHPIETENSDHSCKCKRSFMKRKDELTLEVLEQKVKKIKAKTNKIEEERSAIKNSKMLTQYKIQYYKEKVSSEFIPES